MSEEMRIKKSSNSKTPKYMKLRTNNNIKYYIETQYYTKKWGVEEKMLKDGW